MSPMKTTELLVQTLCYPDGESHLLSALFALSPWLFHEAVSEGQQNTS